MKFKFKNFKTKRSPAYEKAKFGVVYGFIMRQLQAAKEMIKMMIKLNYEIETLKIKTQTTENPRFCGLAKMLIFTSEKTDVGGRGGSGPWLVLRARCCCQRLIWRRRRRTRAAAAEDTAAFFLRTNKETK